MCSSRLCQHRTCIRRRSICHHPSQTTSTTSSPFRGMPRGPHTNPLHFHIRDELLLCSFLRRSRSNEQHDHSSSYWRGTSATEYQHFSGRVQSPWQWMLQACSWPRLVPSDRMHSSSDGEWQVFWSKHWSCNRNHTLCHNICLTATPA